MLCRRCNQSGWWRKSSKICRYWNLHFHPSPKFQLFIQARMHSSTSVSVAEAGGLALAARCCRLLNLQEVSFFSDNETLVNIINDRFQSSKPWSIKPFTADFSFQVQNKRFQVLKINRVDKCTCSQSCLPSKILCFLSLLLLL